jgi:hypothetical protein
MVIIAFKSLVLEFGSFAVPTICLAIDQKEVVCQNSSIDLSCMHIYYDILTTFPSSFLSDVTTIEVTITYGFEKSRSQCSA